jgi:tRNA pseudouridine13 synthase
MGLDMSYRPARVLLDDFCWQFCEDDSLQLEFSLRTGSYATSVLAELVQYTDISRNGG